MLEAARLHYLSQQRLAQRTAATAGAIWSRHLNPEDLQASFTRSVAPRLLPLLLAQQATAAAAADPYTDQVLDDQGLPTSSTGRVVPAAFTATASDGRELATLLYEPVIRVKVRLLEGYQLPDALTGGLDALMRIVATQVTDAGRIAAGVALVAHPYAGGYVRMLSLPSCARCTVLAGRFYKWNAGFKRHPRCDCQHIPSSEDVAGDLRTDPRKAIESGQVHGLSLSDLRAIADGSDVGQVINAQRGMYTANTYGRTVKATQEGVTVRGTAGAAMKASGGSYTKTPRLRPEAIYALAGDDRAKALKLLTRFGYLRP